MITYECTNVACDEHGVPKASPVDVGDLVITCGECRMPCTKHAPDEGGE